MKKILFILLLISSTSVVVAQKDQKSILYRVQYDYTGTPDTLNLNYKANLFYYLDMTMSESFFYNPNRLQGDSLIKYDKINKEDIFVLASMPKYNRNAPSFMAYNNLNDDKMIIWDNIGKDFQYNESKSFLKWEFYNDSLIIQNLKCFKATTHFRGRDFIAWYTNSIPYQFGPWKFGGLPGLILLIEDTKHQFSFKAKWIQSFNLNDNLRLQNSYIENPVKVTFKDIFKYKKWRNDDPQGFLDFIVGGSVSVTIKSNNNNNTSSKKPYNPLEIEY